jgi:adenylate kinase
VYRDQTSALVGYYSNLAASGQKDAPKYRRVSGVGGVDEIKQRVSAALSS